MHDTGAPTMSSIQKFSAEGVQDMVFQLQSLVGGKGGTKKRKKVQVKEAKTLLKDEELARLVDQEQVHRDALKLAEESGIIFIAELDSVASKGGPRSGGPDASREGAHGPGGAARTQATGREPGSRRPLSRRGGKARSRGASRGVRGRGRRSGQRRGRRPR